MKSILQAIIVIIAITSSSSAYSQTKEEVYTNIQSLLSKATGEKIKSFTGEEKITKQLFSEKTVARYLKGMGKYGSEWVYRYSTIPWNDLFEHYIFSESSNEKLQLVQLKFKKAFTLEQFTSDKNGSDNPREYNMIELYVRDKDEAELDKYFKLLYTFKEKKSESPLNQQIRNFNKAQTIYWLTEKLNKNIEAGQYDRDIKIVSLNECMIVVTYSGLIRKYEEILPTAIKSISKYGGLEYNTKVASMRTLTPDAMDNGEKTYRNFSSIGIGNNDEELMENVECAFKHLASFCGASSSSSGTASSPTTAVISDPTIPNIEIGNQTWMLKNLDTDRFRNGDRIAQARTAAEWKIAVQDQTPAWCYVEYDAGNNTKFGKMYNFYCVVDERGLAPEGWHVPSLAEARVLINELGGEKTASHALRSKAGWRDNANSTNESGFTAYGAGKCWIDGSFLDKNFSGYFATTTKNAPDKKGDFQVNYFLVQQTSGTVYNNHSTFRGCGISVRCIKD